MLSDCAGELVLASCLLYPVCHKDELGHRFLLMKLFVAVLQILKDELSVGPEFGIKFLQVALKELKDMPLVEGDAGPMASAPARL